MTVGLTGHCSLLPQMRGAVELCEFLNIPSLSTIQTFVDDYADASTDELKRSSALSEVLQKGLRDLSALSGENL